MTSAYPTPRAIQQDDVPLPAGVAFRPLTTHRDSRGDLTAAFTSIAIITICSSSPAAR
jgi:hypothetical protein